MADFLTQLQALKDDLAVQNVELAADRKAAADSLARADVAALDAKSASAKVDALAVKDDALVAAALVTETKVQLVSDNLSALLQALIDAHVVVPPAPPVLP